MHSPQAEGVVRFPYAHHKHQQPLFCAWCGKLFFITVHPHMFAEIRTWDTMTCFAKWMERHGGEYYDFPPK